MPTKTDKDKMNYRNILAISCILLTSQLTAHNYYVSVHGSDKSKGNISDPFASLQMAQSLVQPGDTVFIRGGIYILQENQVMTPRKANYTYVFNLDKSGTKEKPICYFAYPGDPRPVFNFENIKPEGLRVTAFNIGASYLHLKGFDIVGLQVTIKGHTQSEGISFHQENGNNIVEQINIHDGMGIGVYMKRGHDNLILNCDAYNNYDSFSENGKGGNSDGFGCHVQPQDTGNIFRGCRSWRNSDDGFDLIHCYASVTFDHCWAIENGFDKDMNSRADGNGFKAGGYGKKALDEPLHAPSHTITHCIAVGNKANGFYANHHLAGNTWINNSAAGNKVNYCMTNQQDWKTPVDIEGYDHVLKNNLSFKPKRAHYTMIDIQRCTLTNNTFAQQKDSLSNKDFESTGSSQLLKPRKGNGNLPDISYLKIKPTSIFNDKQVGYQY